MSLDDYYMQMEDLQKCYKGYGKQLTIHAILSPAIENGKTLATPQWQKIADDYLSKINMQDLQAIGFLHADKEHRHLHLVINKVKEKDFKLAHDSYIGKKSQKAADDIAREMKLVRAAEIRQAKINEASRVTEAIKIGILPPKEKPLVGIKQHFKAILEELLKVTYHSTIEYFKALEKAGFKVHTYNDKETGELRGYGIEKEGTKMDASAISKKFTLKALNISGDNMIQIKPANDLKESLNQLEPIMTLKDILKINVLENYASSMGITKETLENNQDIEMVEKGKRFFLAMKNDSGGYTLNNVYSKQYFGEDDISTRFINKEFQTVVIEDMFAYLLHKQQNQNSVYNYIILHSATNKEKAVNKIAELNLNDVRFQLKNDSIGKLVTQEISKALENIADKKNLEIKGNKRHVAHEKTIL
jgi:Relaxase/Mobilisation nuclease domain